MGDIKQIKTQRGKIRRESAGIRSYSDRYEAGLADEVGGKYKAWLKRRGYSDYEFAPKMERRIDRE